MPVRPAWADVGDPSSTGGGVASTADDTTADTLEDATESPRRMPAWTGAAVSLEPPTTEIPRIVLPLSEEPALEGAGPLDDRPEPAAAPTSAADVAEPAAAPSRSSWFTRAATASPVEAIPDADGATAPIPALVTAGPADAVEGSTASAEPEAATAPPAEAGSAVSLTRAAPTEKIPATQETAPQPKPAWRAPGLDGLRALAVLAVMAFHEGLPWIHGGFLGVDVFFVLSGYLITDLLVARFKRAKRVDLGGFYQRRARRLLPALGLMLVTVTAAVAVLEPAQMAALRPALLGAVTYTSNWWQAFAHISYFQRFGPPPTFQHLWSLAVEEQFYLIWPLIVWAALVVIRRPRLCSLVAWAGAAASVFAVIAIYKPGTDPSLVYYGTDTHASGLMIGAALALTWPLAQVAAASKRIRVPLDIAGAIGILVLAFAVWHFSGSDPFMYPYGMVIAGVAAGALVLAATAPGRIGTMLSWKPLRWLGVRSYGIYLWHWPVIAIAAGIAARSTSTIQVRVLETLLPIALAALSWYWLEEPILRSGFRSDMARRARLLKRALLVGWRAPAALPPLATTLAVLLIVGTAGYGLVNRQTTHTLQQQIAKNAQIVSAYNLPIPSVTPRDLYGNPWWIKAVNGPYRVRTHTRPVIKSPGSKVIAIGDSVMLASAAGLEQELPGIFVNAQVSRAMVAGIVIVQQLARAKHLRPILMVGLGTNGPITLSQIEQLRAAIGDRWLILVNVFENRSWENEVNQTIWTAARRYPNVMVVNWHKAIAHHTNLLWSDGIHPMPVGGIFYAKVVRKVVLKALRKKPVLHRRKAPPKPPADFQLHISDGRQA